MSDKSRVLLDIAMLAEVDGEKVRARKLREAYDYTFNLEKRLEVYSAPNAHGETLYLGIGSTDGIGCRDETIKLLDARIETLESGGCRYHCRVRSEMWMEGFDWGVRHINLSHGITKPQHFGDADKQYKVWRENDGK